MNLLRRPINEITFDDVVLFCQKKHPEGIQLDYKVNLSDKGLKKHFAAFSNARGGLIIIGVGENSDTGLPETWEGIDLTGKPEDQIHQAAQNVDPVPRYEVSTTNADTNGKVFILVRILEGDRTPYYVLNDANIYIRTGNVTNRCEEQASPQEIARLFGKTRESREMREQYLQQAQNIYTAALNLSKLAAQKYNKHLPHGECSYDVPSLSVLTLSLQPNRPDAALTSPAKVYRCAEIERAKRLSWIDGHDFSPIPNGVIIERKSIGKSSYYKDFYLVFAQGLGFSRHELNWADGERQPFHFLIENIIDNFSTFMIFMKDYCKEVGYIGNLQGTIALSITDGVVCAVDSNSYQYNRYKDILNIDYNWSLQTDTSILFNSQELKKYSMEQIESVIWGLGFQEANDIVKLFPWDTKYSF